MFKTLIFGLVSTSVYIRLVTQITLLVLTIRFIKDEEIVGEIITDCPTPVLKVVRNRGIDFTISDIRTYKGEAISEGLGYLHLGSTNLWNVAAASMLLGTDMVLVSDESGWGDDIVLRRSNSFAHND